MEFVCQYCGKQFTRTSDLIRHEKSCVNRNERERFLRLRRSWSNQQKQQYIKEGHNCKSCGALLTEFYSSGEYCSRACANRRNQTDEIKQKISDGVDRHNLEVGIIPVKIRSKSYCKDCGVMTSGGQSGYCVKCGPSHYNKNNKRVYKHGNQVLCGDCNKPLHRRNKTGYCNDCYRKHFGEWATESTIERCIEAGKKSAQSQQRRSKNEIAFCELCEQYFTNVTHNQPIFNSWDADIILVDYKIAILWNGIWHYKQISKKQSLLQVQTRDKIKIDQIISCGYTPYIIKDMGKADKHKVENEFYEFVRWLNDKNLCQHNN